MRIIRYSYPNSRRLAVAPSRFSRSPWSSFENEIDRWFETTLGDSAPDQTTGACFPVDFYEDKDRTYVRAELPGVNREDINVEVADGRLTIAATRKTAAPASSEGQPEQSFSFNRSLELPEEVQADKISAVYENGVLTVTLPKREETKPKKISVTVQ
jgi:HSP20 family protein